MSTQFHSLLSEFTKSYQTLSRTKKLHSFLTKTHFSKDPFYATKIIRFYAMNDDLHSARNLFDKTPQRSVFLWNSIIRAYAQAQRFHVAISLFSNMFTTETKPDSFTFACVVRSCSEGFDLARLKCVHGVAVVSGFGLDPVCASALVTAYSKLGVVDEGSKVFYGIPEPDLVLWNSMISGHANYGFSGNGFRLFSSMRREGKHPDGFTLVGLISGLTDCSLLSVSQSVHGFCLKTNFDSNGHVGSALVSMYSRCECMRSAFEVFRNLSDTDLVTWSALITGYYRCGDHDQALHFFRKLNMNGKKADPVLVATVLVASAQLSNVRPGSELHSYAIRQGMESNVMISSALVDMYSKCGFISSANLVFDSTTERNIVSYNSIILGLGLHGHATRAFEKFKEVIKVGLKPDESTFSSLLSVCCHSGLVNDGREVFRTMRDVFRIQPKTEHYVYMVKLIGMSGELGDAYEFVLNMVEPVDCGVWGALLSCCNFHGNSEMAEIVARRLFVNEPEKGVYKVMLSNLYATDGRWDDVKMLRDDDTFDRRVRKVPGLSRI